MDSLKLVCRVCLHCNPETNSFFDEVEYDVYIKLAKVFHKVTDIEVLESDEDKPSHLCHDCTERLLSAYDFICSVEKAEQEIENYLRLQSEAKEQQQVEEVDQGDNVLEVDATDIDIQDIEVLDEEFQTTEEHQIESHSSEELLVEIGTPHEEILETSIANVHEISPEEEIRTDVSVRSRLSKNLSHRYDCISCQRSFAKKETLERHTKTAHTVVYPLNITTSNVSAAQSKAAPNNSPDDKRITCSHCPQMFKRRNYYIRHLLTSHSYDAEQLPAEDQELLQPKHTYKRSNCPYCGENFTQASLIVHIRRHTGENPYMCDQCSKGFPRRQDLLVHQRQHTGEKPHSCTICGKSFSRTNKLARHMRVHTGERPYKCTECQRSFAQSNDLKIHMRRHTGEKPYKCNVCLEAFICGAALKTHRRQKDHHSPQDEHDDPFANWRVSKRKLKVEAIQKEPVESKDECYGESIFPDNQPQLHHLKKEDVCNRETPKEEIVESMEFVEIIQE